MRLSFVNYRNFRCGFSILFFALLSMNASSSNSSDSNMALSFYESGKRALEGRNGGGGAKKIMEDAKSQLGEFMLGKFTLEEVEQILSGEISFVDFFDRLGQKAYSQMDKENLETTKSLYRQAAYKFQDSLEEFNKAISFNPKYADAYLKNAKACVELGRLSEAIKSYKNAKSFGFEGISLNFDEVRNIFYKVASAYSQMGWNSELSDGDPAIEVIKDLISILEKKLREQINSTSDDLEKQRLENQIEVNRFELVNFFIQIGKGRSARDEYEFQKALIQPKLNRDQLFYAEAAAQIETMEADIRQASVSFFKLKLDPNFPHVSVRILPTDFSHLIARISISFGSVDAASSASSEAPAFKINKIKLIDELNKLPTHPKLKDFGYSLPVGGYMFLIDIPRIEVARKNHIPFELIIQKGMNYEETLIVDHAKNSVKDENVIKDRDLMIVLRDIDDQTPDIELRGGQYKYESGQITGDKEIKEIIENEYEIKIRFKIPHKFVIGGEEYKIELRSTEPPKSKFNVHLTAGSAILTALILSTVYR